MCGGGYEGDNMEKRISEVMMDKEDELAAKAVKANNLKVPEHLWHSNIITKLSKHCKGINKSHSKPNFND